MKKDDLLVLLEKHNGHAGNVKSEISKMGILSKKEEKEAEQKYREMWDRRRNPGEIRLWPAERKKYSKKKVKFDGDVRIFSGSKKKKKSKRGEKSRKKKSRKKKSRKKHSRKKKSKRSSKKKSKRSSKKKSKRSSKKK